MQKISEKKMPKRSDDVFSLKIVGVDGFDSSPATRKHHSSVLLRNATFFNLKMNAAKEEL